jgi:hypothetical protein
MEFALSLDGPIRARAGYSNGAQPMEIDMLAMTTRQPHNQSWRRNHNTNTRTQQNPQSHQHSPSTPDEVRLRQLRSQPLPKLTDSDRELLNKHNLCKRCRALPRGHAQACPGIPQGGSQPGQH